MSIEILKPNGEFLNYLESPTGLYMYTMEDITRFCYFGSLDRLFICHLLENYQPVKGFKLCKDSKVIAEWVENNLVAYCILKEKRYSAAFSQDANFLHDLAQRDIKTCVQAYKNLKIVLLNNQEEIPPKDELSFLLAVSDTNTFEEFYSGTVSPYC